MGVMIVMPTFAEAEQGNEPVVPRIVPRLEPPRTPEMRQRVHHPSRMQIRSDAKTYAPQEERQSPANQQQRRKNQQGHRVIPRYPYDKRILQQVRGIPPALFRTALGRVPDQHPDNMRPPFPVPRRMRVAGAIGELMMEPMRRYPEQRAAFQRERPANRQKIFDAPRNFIGSVSEQAVIAHADSKTESNPIKQDRRNCGRPTEVEQSGHGPNMDNRKRYDGDPVEAHMAILSSFKALQQAS